MASLDMSLNDMIKSRRNNERGRGQGRARRGRGSGGSFRGGRTGPPHRGSLGVNVRPSASAIAKSIRRPKNLPWQNGLLEDSLKAAGLSGLENGTKLYVSNLAVGVSNEDIRELYSEIGELMRYGIHFDKNGRPSGSAEVVFARRSDAFLALKRYNNVQLDGKPMKIEIVGAKAEVPVSARVNVVGGANGRTVVMTPRPGRARGSAAVNRGFGPQNRGAFRSGRGGAGRGSATQGGGGGRGRGRGRGGRGGKKSVEKTAEELDKELETYHAEAMQT